MTSIFFGFSGKHGKMFVGRDKKGDDVFFVKCITGMSTNYYGYVQRREDGIIVKKD